ncbi:MAG: glutathione peroxidase, partial [Ilumatobacteraceae bacterium]
MSIYNVKIKGLTSTTDVLAARSGGVTLVVNVASKCGLTPQYTGLEALHKEFAKDGFSVVGVPCNQFGGQEPG